MKLIVTALGAVALAVSGGGEGVLAGVQGGVNTAGNGPRSAVKPVSEFRRVFPPSASRRRSAHRPWSYGNSPYYQRPWAYGTGPYYRRPPVQYYPYYVVPQPYYYRPYYGYPAPYRYRTYYRFRGF